MSFASSVTVLGDAPPPVHSPESSAQELLHSAIAEEDVVDTEGGAMDSTDTPAPIIPPPPGFRQFSWPNEDWRVSDDLSLFRLRRNSLAGSLGLLGACRLICRRCSCRRSFRIVWTIL